MANIGRPGPRAFNRDFLLRRGESLFFYPWKYFRAGFRPPDLFENSAWANQPLWSRPAEAFYDLGVLRWEWDRPAGAYPGSRYYLDLELTFDINFYKAHWHYISGHGINVDNSFTDVTAYNMANLGVNGSAWYFTGSNIHANSPLVGYFGYEWYMGPEPS